jgi:hypothetical protein
MFFDKHLKKEKITFIVKLMLPTYAKKKKIEEVKLVHPNWHQRE